MLAATLVAGCTWLCVRLGHTSMNMTRMLDSAVGSVIIVRNFTVVTANETTVRTFGFTSKLELEGQDLSALLHAHDARVLQSQFGAHELSGNVAIFTARGNQSPASTCYLAQPASPATRPRNSVL